MLASVLVKMVASELRKDGGIHRLVGRVGGFEEKV